MELQQMVGRPYKILYIEDQPEMIDLVRLTVRRMDCEVFGATDGIQGLQMMREIRPDLVLLDLMLPGWDGWQVSKAMQADADLKDMPVILVTARVSISYASSERQPPPAAACVTKPFSLGELRTAIQSVLGQAVMLPQVA
jgi:CheY-like chemotaxis protein